MGLTVANSYRQRVQNLRQLAAFMQCLESEISYAHTALPEVISRQKHEHTGAVRHFLSVLDAALAAGEGESFVAIWERGPVHSGPKRSTRLACG